MPVSAKPSSGGKENFVGCMEDITYNGDNITNLVKRKKVDISSFVRASSERSHSGGWGESLSLLGSLLIIVFVWGKGRG